MSHRPRKRFGQNFLVDSTVIDNIVAAIHPQPDETIVEIGPGLGAITEPLHQSGALLHVVELDRDLARKIMNRYGGDDRLTVHEADALRFDFSRLGDELRIVGNLPYNISTPLLFHLLDHSSNVRDMHFMLQKDVVDRMAASPGGKSYGRLTIMLGCRMEIVALFDVPPTAFSPRPRVESTIVRMRPLAKDTYPVNDAERLSQVVAAAFSQRRKTMRNALKTQATAEDLEAVSIDPGARPEQIAIAEWVALANHLSP